MRPRFAHAVAVLAAHIGLATSQDLTSLSECGVSCYNRVIASGLNCDSGDNACLCANPNFAFGLRDCAEQACTPDDVTQVTTFSETLCAANPSEPSPDATPSSSPTPEPAPSPDATPSLDAAPTVSTTTVLPHSPPASSPAPVEASTEPPSTTSTTAEPTVVDEAVPTTTAASSDLPEPLSSTSADSAAAETTSATVTTLITVTSSNVSSSTEAAPTDSASSQQSDEGSQDSGDDDGSIEPPSLTTAALAGIGIGAGVAALGSGFALYLLLRKRRSTHVRSMQISPPILGSGRDYSGGFGSSSSNLTELEAKSKRYEDMIPRQSPKSII